MPSPEEDNFCRAVNIDWPYVDQKWNGELDFEGPIIRKCVFHVDAKVFLTC